MKTWQRKRDQGRRVFHEATPQCTSPAYEEGASCSFTIQEFEPCTV